MPLPVSYIQNYSIEFSRISRYYTKKKTVKQFGPFQISAAETELGKSDGSGEKGRKKSSLPHQHNQTPWNPIKIWWVWEKWSPRFFYL